MRSVLIAFALFSAPIAAQQSGRTALQMPVSGFSFEENVGQVICDNGKPADFILLRAQLPNTDLYITDKGISYVFYEFIRERGREYSFREEKEKQGKPKKYKFTRVDVELKGAAVKKENFIAGEYATGESRYFLNGSSNFVTAKKYSSFAISNIYPGIDWVWHADEGGGMKYDFVVHPGADPALIQMEYKYADLSLKDNGQSLHISTPLASITEGKAVSFCNGKEIPTYYHINDNIVTFKLSDPEVSKAVLQGKPFQTLVIDPPLQLFWCCTFGGSSTGIGFGVCSDIAGNGYFTGYTNANNFPTLNPGGGAYFQGVATSFNIAFLSKFDNNSVMLWSTYFGGNISDMGLSVCTDPSGNLFFTGETASGNLPTFNPGGGAYFQGVTTGGNDAWMMKFSPTGVMLWGTYFGGSGSEFGYDIECDPAGNVFLIGFTGSVDLPTLNPGGGAYFQAANGGSNDIYVAKFSNNCQLLWSTYYGGTGTENGYNVSTDAAGNVAVTGSSNGGVTPTFNPGGGAYFQPVNAGLDDAVYLKFSNTGVLQWGTYFGGSGSDLGFAVASDPAGNIFGSGQTLSGNLPTLNPGGGAYFQPANAGAEDSWVVRFDVGCIMTWSTYFGGNQADFSLSYNYLDIGGCADNLYFGFITSSTNWPTQNPGNSAYFDNTLDGPYDLVWAEFNNAGVMKWSTYFGGTGKDDVANLSCDPLGNFYLTGDAGGSGYSAANAATFPYTNPGNGAFFQPLNGAGGDYCFVGKFLGYPPLTATATPTNILCFGQNNGQAIVNITTGSPNYTYSWAPSGGTSATATGLSAGNYTVTITDASGCPITVTVTITQPVSALTANATSTNTGCNTSTGTGTVTASGGTGPYTYAWTPSGGTNANATGLGAGQYTITVTDANGCTQTDTVGVTSAGAQTVTLASQTNVLCFGNTTGAATVTVMGGTTPYIYSWSPSGGTNATATGLGANTYTVSVTDAAGCTVTFTVTITQPASAINPGATATNILCNGGTNGTATATVTGGTPGYTYLWSTGGTTNSISNLGQGTYTVTITDANGCTATSTVTVTDPSPLSTSLTPSNATCGNSNGSLSATPTGGTSPYTYLWNTSETTSSITGLAAGTYSVVITDANGCTQTATVTITNSVNPTAGINANVTIYNGNSTTLTATGGGNYSWSPATGLSCTSCPNPAAAPSVTTLYCVTVTDVLGCTDSACVLVTVDNTCQTNTEFAVPNAFSPNKDGNNDGFCLQGWKNCVKAFAVTIYDRWGEKVFESADPNFCWDGTLRSKPMDPAVFVYFIQATLSNGDPLVRKGNVSLIR